VTTSVVDCVIWAIVRFAAPALDKAEFIFIRVAKCCWTQEIHDPVYTSMPPILSQGHSKPLFV
jgi:hypothetical protein